MAPGRRVAIGAVGSGLVVLGVGMALPIWTTWYFCPMGAVGHPSTLRVAVAELPDNLREAGLNPARWEPHLDNLVTGGLLLAIAAGVTWAVWRAGVWWARPEAAADREAHGEAVCDGRAEPGVGTGLAPSDGLTLVKVVRDVGSGRGAEARDGLGDRPRASW